jgi:hypothetical protein
LALVFVLFFLLPLGLIVMVSFWRATDYELIPAFTLQELLRHFRGLHPAHRRHVRHPQDLPVHAEVLPAGLGHHPADGLHGGLLPGLPRALARHADGAVHLCTVPFWTSPT